ncbi:Scramblase-domain-containing protein [Dunaliella salina]|uniref:Phospholipid scramblase n=1 Tax=Dunaliella salina TaxID=3046 RepID=A0ABQ7GA14_DUNSA|nr:Scramblase-domain-containing protein [Dunaliella salina]|eukprot:KAF5831444.1 Scramblase-domain-containing protein [Dunaliella salina]
MGRHLGTLSDSNYSDNFKLKDPHGGVLAMVYRKWQGVGKEFFTDAGKYVVHFGQPLSLDSCKPQPPVPSDLDVARPLDLLERVAMLAAVISIDFLHFSTSSEPWFKYGPSIVFPP